MAYRKVDEASLTSVADAIRSKAGTSDALTFPDGFVSAVEGIQAGGGTSGTTSAKDVNFYDYDGTLLHAYTLDEVHALTALPDGPSHSGLVFDGWNWTLEKVKSSTRAINIGAMYSTDDGATRIYIHLEDGRTSPMLGICPNGTVTVYWGDGTDPDTLNGTSLATVKWTPKHEYASPGDYVIRLTVNGHAHLYGNSSSNNNSYILRYSSSADLRNKVYQNAVQKVEIGIGVSIGNYAFQGCYTLSSITIPSSITSIGNYAFQYCYALSSITIPSSITSIGTNAFNSCYALSSITIPSSITNIGNYVFQYCYALSSITIPSSITNIGIGVFSYCYALSSITIPDGVENIGNYAFQGCYTLSSITIPSSITNIGNSAFNNCYGVKYYDFTGHTSVPTLSNTNAFTNIAADCEIRVPTALVDKWKAATNWATYAKYIVGV